MTLELAVVTGGGAGLGKIIVDRLAGQGSHVVIADLDPLRGRWWPMKSNRGAAEPHLFRRTCPGKRRSSADPARGRARTAERSGQQRRRVAAWTAVPRYQGLEPQPGPQPTDADAGDPIGAHLAGSWWRSSQHLQPPNPSLVNLESGSSQPHCSAQGWGRALGHGRRRTLIARRSSIAR